MDKGVRTEYLEYEAYIPMAEKKLAQIGDEIKQQWPGTITTIVHRIGPLNISDIAVLIAVSSPHRKMRIVQMNMRLNVLKKLYQYGRKNLGRWCRMARPSKRHTSRSEER